MLEFEFYFLSKGWYYYHYRHHHHHHHYHYHYYYTQHKSTFTHRKLSNSTKLSKYIWQLTDSNTSFTTKWSIMARARPYHKSSKRRDLCLAQNLYIIKRSNNNLLNKRSELVSKCWHENKFYLKNNWRSSYTIAIVLRSSTFNCFSSDSFTSHPLLCNSSTLLIHWN